MILNLTHVMVSSRTVFNVFVTATSTLSVPKFAMQLHDLNRQMTLRLIPPE